MSSHSAQTGNRFSEERRTRLLLRHKAIDFRQVLFHNIFILLFNPQRLQSALRKRRLRAVTEHKSWKHGGGSLSIFSYKKLRVPY
jgi:hypothetical protein